MFKKIQVEAYTKKDGEVWKGKLSALPRVGDLICVNNKSRFGYFSVSAVTWHVDQDRAVLILVEQ